MKKPSIIDDEHIPTYDAERRKQVDDFFDAIESMPGVRIEVKAIPYREGDLHADLELSSGDPGLGPVDEGNEPTGEIICDEHEYTDFVAGFQEFEITSGEDSVNWCKHCHCLYAISGEYLGRLEFADGKIMMTPKEES